MNMHVCKSFFRFACIGLISAHISLLEGSPLEFLRSMPPPPPGNEGAQESVLT